MIIISLLAGIWSTGCIQTQISNHYSGYVTETYRIVETGEFEFLRSWYRDSNCSEPYGKDTESGTIELGNPIRGLFHPANTFEADFSSQNGIDLGAIAVKEGQHIRVSRGVKNVGMRNAMLSLFEYRKK